MPLVGGPRPCTLVRVLAEGAHSPKKRSRTRAFVAIGAVVVVALVVGGIVVFGGADDVQTKTSTGGTQVAPSTPNFDFKTAKAVAIPTGTQTPKKLKAAATGASRQAVLVLDAVYTEGFLDPNSWNDASYGDVWAQFRKDAATEAESHVDTLTAGSTAGDSYSTIEPAKATIRPRVLMDPKGQPLSVLAIVYFSAKGMHEDGSYTLFRSTGQYFLQKDGSDWKITSFQVSRKDAKKAAPSPTSSGSVSGSTAPSQTGSPS
jgi:hypothetical protein